MTKSVELTFEATLDSTNTNGGGVTSIKLVPMVQGPLCQAAFANATPPGFSEVGSYNVEVAAESKVSARVRNSAVPTESVSTKSPDRIIGKITIPLPEAYQMPGRAFILLCMEKGGSVKSYTDADESDTTLKASDVSVNGYACSLIGSDEVKK